MKGEQYCWRVLLYNGLPDHTKDCEFISIIRDGQTQSLYQPIAVHRHLLNKEVRLKNKIPVDEINDIQSIQ